MEAEDDNLNSDDWYVIDFVSRFSQFNYNYIDIYNYIDKLLATLFSYQRRHYPVKRPCAIINLASFS